MMLFINNIELYICYALFIIACARFTHVALGEARLSFAWRAILAVLASFFVVYLLTMPNVNAIEESIVLHILYLTYLFLCYNVPMAALFISTFIYLMHFMVFRSLATGLWGLYTHVSFFDITASNDNLLPICIITSLLSAFAISSALLLFPHRHLKFYRHKIKQTVPIVAWLFLFNVFLIFNSLAYFEPIVGSYMFIYQMITPLIILIGMYLVVYSYTKTTELDHYKSKSSELLKKLDNDILFREFMIRESIVSYDFNCSKNTIQRINAENIDEPYEMQSFQTYMVKSVQRLIHPDDVAKAMPFLAPQAFIDAYKRGESEISIEYRRLTEDDHFKWVRLTAHFMETLSHEIKGFAYVKDIDALKKEQFELKYKAERDPLTGAYNKEMTEKLIRVSLETKNIGSLFIIDIDNFKAINDNFGHAFGDVVIAEALNKIKKVFRENDIIGRIGGDEFLVFMPTSLSQSLLRTKAEQLCHELLISYTNNKNKVFSISASVGIATAPTDGLVFQHLYEHADIALYQSKNKGKNTYTFYDGSDFKGITPAHTEIDSQEFMQKSFAENRAEYIFKILYSAEKPQKVLSTVIELIVKHFSFDRGYILSYDDYGKRMSNIYEWKNKNIPSCRTPLNAHIQDIPQEVMETFKTQSALIYPNIDLLSPVMHDFFKSCSVRATFQFPMMSDNLFIGTIGFDFCHTTDNLTAEEIDSLNTICTVLSTFFLKIHINEKMSHVLDILHQLMDKIDFYIYVVNKKDQAILYFNKRMSKQKLEEEIITEVLAQLEDNLTNGSLYAQAQNIRFIEQDQQWIEVKASYIPWYTGDESYLVTFQNISKYMYLIDANKRPFLEPKKR